MNHALVETLSAQQKPRSAGATENRKQHRHPIHWRIALVHRYSDRNDIYHGRTHDLSVLGASIFVDYNIFMMSELVLLLAIPPLQPGHQETIIEIQCRMVYTILASAQSQFRIGIRFLDFKGDGKRLLSDILSKRVIPETTPNSYVVE